MKRTLKNLASVTPALGLQTFFDFLGDVRKKRTSPPRCTEIPNIVCENRTSDVCFSPTSLGKCSVLTDICLFDMTYHYLVELPS